MGARSRETCLLAAAWFAKHQTLLHARSRSWLHLSRAAFLLQMSRSSLGSPGMRELSAPLLCSRMGLLGHLGTELAGLLCTIGVQTSAWLLEGKKKQKTLQGISAPCAFCFSCWRYPHWCQMWLNSAQSSIEVRWCCGLDPARCFL